MKRIASRQLAAAAMVFFSLVIGATAFAQPSAPALPKGDPRRFEKDIEAFLVADKQAPPQKGQILFIGSSIFRLWKNLKEQMAPLPVFNRAFGGSRTADILYYRDKVVLPYEPKIIVYYCGSNDINADITPDKIAANFREFTQRVHARLPQTKIFYVSINRAPQKMDRWIGWTTRTGKSKSFAKKTKSLASLM
ncbi:MAG: hypothetical protein JNK38_10255 [Acidobacteria bacterium]|nr:hypothetical protein [Acidobacteriota bacterium]